jgi:uncharacterized protein (DUF2384 family)
MPEAVPECRFRVGRFQVSRHAKVWCVTLAQELLQLGPVSTTDVAHLLGITERSAARWKQGQPGPRQAHHVERLLELKAVLDRALQVMSVDSAGMWLRSPVPSLKYYKPLDLIRDGDYRRVIAALRHQTAETQ